MLWLPSDFHAIGAFCVNFIQSEPKTQADEQKKAWLRIEFVSTNIVPDKKI
jgi:hypothetical protein